MPGLATAPFDEAFPWAARLHETPLCSLAYVDEGAGDPVLLVHGDPTWGYLWRRFVGPLAEIARCIVPDQMGMGRSSAPAEPWPYRLEHHVANLEHLVLALDLRRITLVVHDWGGPVGLGVAVRHPERISRLVLTNTWAHADWPGAPLPRLLELIRSPRGEQLVLERNGYVEPALRGTTSTPLADATVAAYLAPFPTPDSRRALLCWTRDIPLVPGDPSHATLREIEERLPLLHGLPVLVAWGLLDPVLPESVLDRWCETFRQAEVLRLPGASHFLQEDAADALVAAVVAFAR